MGGVCTFCSPSLFWHLGEDDDTRSMGGVRVEGVRLNAYRRAGVRMQLGVVGEGRLLVANLLTDPSFSGSVRGAVVVVGSRFFPVLFLLLFHPFRFGLVLQFSILPLGGEGS